MIQNGWVNFVIKLVIFVLCPCLISTTDRTTTKVLMLSVSETFVTNSVMTWYSTTTQGTDGANESFSHDLKHCTQLLLFFDFESRECVMELFQFNNLVELSKLSGTFRVVLWMSRFGTGTGTRTGFVWVWVWVWSSGTVCAVRRKGKIDMNNFIFQLSLLSFVFDFCL